MISNFRRSAPPLIALALVTGALAWPRAAEAKGTLFLLELNTGISESPYVEGGPTLSYGASAGVTVRVPATVLRLHLMGTVAHRAGTVVGIHAGTTYLAERSDLDVYAGPRVVLPVWRMIRIYGELGLGTRFSTSMLQRGDGLGGLNGRDRRFLVVTAVGIQARVTPMLSVGLRGELAPLTAAPDLATFAADLSPTQNRLTGMATVGVHL